MLLDAEGETDAEVAARCAVTHLIKARARFYLRRPLALEALYPGLSSAAGGTMLAVAAHLLERERTSHRRWFGFRGEVALLNYKAVQLLGRLDRRRERRRLGADPGPWFSQTAIPI